MLHVFIGEVLANMTQVSDVAPGLLVSISIEVKICISTVLSVLPLKPVVVA
jgi:hypothetical protein